MTSRILPAQRVSPYSGKCPSLTLGEKLRLGLAADGLEEVHHEPVDPLGGVGLHPVAGLGDLLDPHLRDPGGVRLGQLPAQVAVLVPQMTRVGVSTRRKLCTWASGLARKAAR